jgi:hypothetical protein
MGFSFRRELKNRDDVQSKLKTISVLAVLLQGPFETGNTILGSENLVELMLEMAKSADSIQEVSDEKNSFRIFLHRSNV